VEVHGSQLWLNGKPIKLAGVNRHEIDPLSGRAGTMKHAEHEFFSYRF
jgi:beta-galactosidase/beta-glucuronidase